MTFPVAPCVGNVKTSADTFERFEVGLHTSILDKKAITFSKEDCELS